MFIFYRLSLFAQILVNSQVWALVDARLVSVKMFVAWKVESLIRCCTQVDDLKRT